MFADWNATSTHAVNLTTWSPMAFWLKLFSSNYSFWESRYYRERHERKRRKEIYSGFVQRACESPECTIFQPFFSATLSPRFNSGYFHVCCGQKHTWECQSFLAPVFLAKMIGNKVDLLTCFLQLPTINHIINKNIGGLCVFSFAEVI